MTMSDSYVTLTSRTDAAAALDTESLVVEPGVGAEGTWLAFANDYDGAAGRVPWPTAGPFSDIERAYGWAFDTMGGEHSPADFMEGSDDE